MINSGYPRIIIFQSTLPVGEATLRESFSGRRRIFQSTLPVGEATTTSSIRRCICAISIHASRGGSDVEKLRAGNAGNYFNPRFPWGKRLEASLMSDRPVIISIHASRGGSDRQHSARPARFRHFNPRFPWGKRQSGGKSQWKMKKFQSTLPVGEATNQYPCGLLFWCISIHASRGGSDWQSF